MLYALNQAHASKDIISLVYCSMLRSVASYGYPAWCNISKNRFNQLVILEKRLTKLFRFTVPISIQDFCISTCSRLAAKAMF